MGTVCGGALMMLPSCVHVTTDPIEIKPIHATLDVNVKVERQVDDFFSFEKKDAPATAPAVSQ
jgi:hypothetical protein